MKGRFSWEVLFPVGVTLGMGFEKGGAHDIIAEKLNLSFDATCLEEVMKIHLPDNPHSIVFKRNREEHLQNLQQRFPDYRAQLERFYQEIWKMAAEIKHFIKAMSVMPPKMLGDWRLLIHAMWMSSLSLSFYFFQTVGYLVKKHGL
ncbi:hypothetical protein [Massilibacterium senegalense]|uniref:hypothetical protein n=1 Tax=Massilibacterium senegalense TaxID=1632858 RepID=UPI000782231F|nr:hypothetical protein [Massilibacterium senegalense]